MHWEWPKANEKDLVKYVLRSATELLAITENRYDLLNQANGSYCRKILEEIYNKLVERQVRYALELYDPCNAIQLIRNPRQLLVSPREGTCLDLALLFCGICIGYELLPMIILVQGHAFVAVSLTHHLRNRNHPLRYQGDILNGSKLITDVNLIKELIDSGYYVAIECTGFALSDAIPVSDPEGKNRHNGFLTFDEAIRAGREQLDHRNLHYAIDIATAHYEWRIIPHDLSDIRTVEQVVKRKSDSLNVWNFDLTEYIARCLGELHIRKGLVCFAIHCGSTTLIDNFCNHLRDKWKRNKVKPKYSLIISSSHTSVDNALNLIKRQKNVLKESDVLFYVFISDVGQVEELWPRLLSEFQGDFNNRLIVIFVTEVDLVFPSGIIELGKPEFLNGHIVDWVSQIIHDLEWNDDVKDYWVDKMIAECTLNGKLDFESVYAHLKETTNFLKQQSNPSPNGLRKIIDERYNLYVEAPC